MIRLYRLGTYSASSSENCSLHTEDPPLPISVWLRHVQCRAGLLRARMDRLLRRDFDRAPGNGRTAILWFEEQSPAPSDDPARNHTVAVVPAFQNGQHSPGSEAVAQRRSSVAHASSASSSRFSWTHGPNARASLPWSLWSCPRQSAESSCPRSSNAQKEQTCPMQAVQPETVSSLSSMSPVRTHGTDREPKDDRIEQPVQSVPR